MKHLFKTLAVVAIAAATLASCTKEEVKPTTESTDIDSQASAIIAQFVDHTVAPTYSALAALTEQLADELAALKSNPSQSALTAACSTFLDARAEWEKSEAFLFGAATDFGIDPHIDSWPLDVTGFNTLMNSPAMLQQLAGEDGDEWAGSYLGDALLGFHGIEYILFADGQPKQVNAISADQWTYAVAVAGDLRNRCFQLEVSWIGDAAPAAHIAKVEELELPMGIGDGGLTYGENLKNAGHAGSNYYSAVAGLMQIVDGSKTIADEVGTSKIGAAYTGEDVTYIESPYSHMSITDFHNNIVSIRNAYMGGIEGQRDESKSLHALVAAKNADLDSRVTAAINNAIEKIDAMPAPFVNNISASANGTAMEACQAVDAIFSEVNEMLRTL